MTEPALSDDGYKALASFRYGLRRFLHFSEEAARAAGLTPAQHQLLLAVRGHDGEGPPTIGEVAEHLQLKVHSTGELVGRTVASSGIRENHAVTVVCVKPNGGSFTYATVDTVLAEGDVLVVAGETSAAEAFARLG